MQITLFQRAERRGEERGEKRGQERADPSTRRDILAQLLAVRMGAIGAAVRDRIHAETTLETLEAWPAEKTSRLPPQTP